MASIQHTITAAVNPSDAPPSVGAHYNNTATKQRWVSAGTESVKDWGHPLPGSEFMLGLDQLAYTIDTGVSRVIWTMDAPAQHVVTFGPPPTVPGYYEVDLICETVRTVEPVVGVDFDSSVWIPGLNFDIPNQLYVWPGSATLFRFGLWIAQNAGARRYWRLIESRPLDEPKPVFVSADGASQMLILSSAPQTMWDILSEGAPKRLVLPSLGETFSNDLFTKVDLVIRNATTKSLDVTVDEDLGFPLPGVTTLTIPAGETMLYRLAYFVGFAQHSWSLLSSHQLAPKKP
jgi:hypothetical protein